jgi:antitoxin HigA-1
MEQAGTSSAIHPGEVLREEFLIPLGVTAYRLAKALGIPESALSEILHAKRGITVVMALLLSRFFGTSPELWLNLQAAYDLDEERARLAPRLEAITPAALDELHQQRMKELEERRRPLHADLAAAQLQLAEQLGQIQPHERPAPVEEGRKPSRKR